MQPHIGTGDGPPTRRRSADDVSPARFSDGGSPGQLQQVERASSFPPGPSRLRDTALYGQPLSRTPIPLRQHKPSPPLPSSSIAYSPWDVRLSPIDFSDDNKGKQRSHYPDTPCESLSPAATGSIASSAASPRDSSDEAPIRIRRVGALGISVASNSDDESNGVDMGRVSLRQRSKARSRGVDRDGSSMSSGEVEMADDGPLGSSADELRGSKSMRKSRGISDEHFRSIVDELAIENQELKARIRRYEAGQLPEVVKEDRVVELRYFDRLPSTQREELSDLIARYLQQHSTTSPSFFPEISSAPISHPSPPHLFASAPPVADYGFPGQLQLPIIPDRTLHRSPRKRNERERLAGPSNSGVEPQSLTGTGSGIRFGWGPKAEAGRKAKRAKLERTPSSSAPAPIEGQDEPRAKELIHVLEHLFEGSLLVQTEDSKVKKRRGSTGSQNGTNEAYLGHLLENDDLSGGWMFLNLVCTMAQIHRFNVTLPFVRAAVSSLSHNLEISADGSKIRWNGPRPHSSPPSATPGSVDDLDSRPAMSRCSSSDRSLSIVSGGQTATASSSSEGATRLGSGSGEGSTEASTAATSIAPHPSEILLKATAPPSALASQYNVAPTASSDEDVTMSSATESMSPEAAALHVQLPGPHTFVPCPYRSPDGQFALVRSPDELSEGEGAVAEAGGAREAAASTLVFYSDVGFCSDFSRSSTSPVAPSYTSSIRKPLGLGREFACVEGDSWTTEPMLASLKEVDDLAVIYGAETVTHPLPISGPLTRSSSAELDLFRTSTGMTNSTTTDLFTVLVKTRLPFQALDSTSRGVKRTADLAFGSATVEENPFFRRDARQSGMDGTTIISATTTFHNPRIVPRRPILPHLLSSDESSSEESSTPSDSPPRPVQRPPSPDYLLSFSLPFFSWAPRETGAAYRWPGDDVQQQAALDKSMAGAPIRQAIAEVTTMGGKGGSAFSRQSAESAKTGGGRSVVPAESSDEGMPIDLDDSVLAPREPILCEARAPPSVFLPPFRCLQPVTMPRLPVARQLFASPSASSWALSLTTQQHYRHASSRSSSSSQWLQRQRSDPFVRARSTGELDPSSSSADAFVSRSAFKLVELQQKSRGALLRPGMCVVDLGAAPGGWVQAAQRELSSTSSKGRSKQRGGVIVGVDLLPLHASVAEVVTAIAEARGGAGTTARVDLVLSDMLANLTGNLLRDAQLSLDLCEAALAFALDHLAPPPASPSPSATGKRNKRGPSLVMKCLQSSLSPAFQDVLKEHFEGVAWSKPSSSRPESREGYWVCSGLRSGRGKEQDSWEDGEGGEGDGIYF